MNYFRQALAMMREEKLYSAMYICGTALAIAFTMLIAEVYYIKVADIAPEVNRSKTYYLEYMLRKNDDNNATLIYWDNFRDLFQKMQTPECVTAVMDYWSSNGYYIKLADGRHDRAVKLMVTEPGFFRFFQFRFTEGAPFTQDDFDSRRRNVVITEEIREVLFGKEGKAVGSTLTYNYQEYRICGVVETPSVLTEACVADIYMPAAADGLLRDWGAGYERQSYKVCLSVPDGKHETFMQELKEVEARYNSMHPDQPVDMTTSIQTHYTKVWNELGSVFDARGDDLIWYVVPGILLLLIVPALNLSGMVASRMERRLPEMAIRKAFGARRRTLLGQVVAENLMLTLIGGAVGLCLAWMALYGWRDWLFYTFSNNANLYGVVPILKGEMFFGPVIFLIALLICSVLNLLAATLPAWLSLRKPIVESMMIKK
ncbi:MAG: ABC transporter permease [Bacteroidaceae bacterium]|nr:ABC transporter permease [Bacteroidaceae bacterium]